MNANSSTINTHDNVQSIDNNGQTTCNNICLKPSSGTTIVRNPPNNQNINHRRSPSSSHGNSPKSRVLLGGTHHRYMLIGLIVVSSLIAMSWMIFFHNNIVVQKATSTMDDRHHQLHLHQLPNHQQFDKLIRNNKNSNKSLQDQKLRNSDPMDTSPRTSSPHQDHNDTSLPDHLKQRMFPKPNNPFTGFTNTTKCIGKKNKNKQFMVSNEPSPRSSAPTNATTNTKPHLSRCFPYNSEQWLVAKSRFGNSNDTSIDFDVVSNTILELTTGSVLLNVDDFLSSTKTLLEQTLCLQASRFLSSMNDEIFSSTNHDVLNPNNQTIDDWSLRLLYYAIHLHQHVPAKMEAEDRLRKFSYKSTGGEDDDDNECDSQTLNSLQIGHFDYECPNTKFLIVPLGQKGLGAVMRLGVVNAFIAGIASGRVVVFVNNSPTGPREIQHPWLHASCPRRDIQCFFMPVTPCVLTHEDLQQAPMLGRGEARGLFKTGKLPEKFEETKAVVINIKLRPQKTPIIFRKNAVSLINTHLLHPLITDNPSSFDDDPRIQLLQKATEHIYEEEIPRTNGTYYYFGHNVKHNHAFVFYAMRPNHYYKVKLQHIIDTTFGQSSSPPSSSTPTDSNKFDPKIALGLPIRASDKCSSGESECLSFEKYMNLMDYTWDKQKSKLVGTSTGSQFHSLKPSIILTSESSSMHKAQEDFVNHRNHSLLFHFIKNEFDLQQGSGNPSNFWDDPQSVVTSLSVQKPQEKQRNHTTTTTMDDIMLSSISSLQVQLHARYTVGNCCSNFHSLLFDFIKGGCGVNHDHVAECLQDNELPEFRICCQWSKEEHCLTKKNDNLFS